MQKAKDGEDFDALIEQYNTDPGMQGDTVTAKIGYVIAPDDTTYDEDFVAAARTLPNKGDLAQTATTFGVHIIRLQKMCIRDRDSPIRLSAITAGGSQAVFFKVNTLGAVSYTHLFKPGSIPHAAERLGGDLHIDSGGNTVIIQIDIRWIAVASHNDLCIRLFRRRRRTRRRAGGRICRDGGLGGRERRGPAAQRPGPHRL